MGTWLLRFHRIHRHSPTQIVAAGLYTFTLLYIAVTHPWLYGWTAVFIVPWVLSLLLLGSAWTVTGCYALVGIVVVSAGGQLASAQNHEILSGSSWYQFYLFIAVVSWVVVLARNYWVRLTMEVQ